MKIVSWNVFNKNGNTKELLEFLHRTNADVYVLQELTKHHLALIERSLNYKLYTARDFIEGKELTYLGILTKLPSRDPMVIAHNPDVRISPSLVGRLHRWRECIESLSITIEDKQRQIRIINSHLTCGASPTIRIRQLEEIAEHFRDNQNVVLCGDLNTFARPWINLAVGWAFGFRLRDICRNDRNSLEAFASSHAMQPAFQNAVTFPRYGLSLDHILTKGVKVKTSNLEFNTHGSDHRPIIVSLED